MNGRAYDCSTECYLNLHAFTERHDKRDEYSSKGAVGLLIAAGNVGSSLTKFKKADMFLSLDGGKIWKEIAKDAHMYEIIGHGGVVVMVNDEEQVDFCLYSVDGGITFMRKELGKYTDGKKLRIKSIISEPSGTTYYVDLIGKLSDGTSVSIHLDFSSVYSRDCMHSDEDSTRNDYEFWTLSGSSDSNHCVFGAQVQLERRKPDRQCFVTEKYKQLATKLQSCQCSPSDYECDQYHTRQGTTCNPIPNLVIPKDICENGVSYTPTGYVKRKISQCSGGLNLDIDPNAHPCGSSFSWFWFVFLSVPIAALITYGIKSYRNGAFGRYGRIQLPLDTATPVWETRTPFQQFMTNSYYGIINFADYISKLVQNGYTSIRTRMRRSEGYEPVNTHYYDPDLPTPVAHELVWEDEDDSQ